MGRGRGGSIFHQARAHPRASAAEKAAMTRAITRRGAYTVGQRGVQTKAGRVAGLARGILKRSTKAPRKAGAGAKAPAGRKKTPAQVKAAGKKAPRPKKK